MSFIPTYEHDDECAAETDQIFGGIAQCSGHYADVFVESEQFEKLKSGTKNDHSRELGVQFVPLTDGVKIDEFAEFTLVYGFDRQCGEYWAHAEHGHGYDREDDYSHFVQIPEFF